MHLYICKCSGASAFENMMAIDICNYPGLAPDCIGDSSTFDGIANLA